MKFIACLVLCVTASPALATCPDPSLSGPQYTSSGPDLIAPKQWVSEAKGAHPAPCPEWREARVGFDSLTGYLPVAPSAVFNLTQMGPHILTVRAAAECQPVLLVRSGDGLWFIGETVNGVEEVTLWGAPDGPLQVWVGAETESGCTGQIELETYDR